MDRLSTELVRHTCRYLDRPDVKEFRLVCKSYAAIGAEFIRIRSMSTIMTNHHFQELIDLSELKHLAPGLEFLEYVPITLSSPEVDEKYYETWMTPVSEDEPYPPGGYPRYKEIIAEQQSIMKEDRDYQLFVSTLPRFSRLRHLAIYCGDYMKTCYSTTLEAPLDEFQYYFDDFMDNQAGKRHLRTLLRALSNSKVSLESLKIGHIDWHFFDQDDAQLQTIFQPIANLKKFELVIDSNTVQASWDRGNYDDNIRCCSKLMRTGALRKCLSALTNLRSFSICFDYSQDGEAKPIRSSKLKIPLTDIVPSRSVWPRLTSLELRNTICDRQDMMEVFLDYRDTLKELVLYNIYLGNISCILLLDDIRKELLLTRPDVRHSIAGHAEGSDADGRYQFWYLLRPMFIPPFGAEEDELEQAVREHKAREDLGALLKDYLLDGGRAHPEMKSCPLRSDNTGLRV